MSYKTFGRPEQFFKVRKGIKFDDIGCSTLRSVLYDYGDKVWLKITDLDESTGHIRYQIYVEKNGIRKYHCCCNCMYFNELEPEGGQSCIFTDPKFLTKLYV